MVDFRVARDIYAYRSAVHYSNEFLHRGSISRDKLRGVDIRLLQLIRLVLSRSMVAQYNHIDEKTIIFNYNCLIDLAKEIQKAGLIIPMREMSEDDRIYDLDISELAKRPKM